MVCYISHCSAVSFTVILSRTHTARLIEGTPMLQEIAVNSDQLISTVVGFLTQQPREDDDLVDERHICLYNHLRKVTGNKLI